jgi:hypothetical protein
MNLRVVQLGSGRNYSLAAACSGRLTEDWRQSRRIDSLSEKYLVTKLADQCKHTGVDWLEPRFDNRDHDPLPDGWTYAALGVLGAWASGGTPSKSKPEYWSKGTYPWVSPKDMKADFLTDSQDHLTRLGAAELKIVAKDSILFVVRGMILAHTFPVRCPGSKPFSLIAPIPRFEGLNAVVGCSEQKPRPPHFVFDSSDRSERASLNIHAPHGSRSTEHRMRPRSIRDDSRTKSWFRNPRTHPRLAYRKERGRLFHSG